MSRKRHRIAVTQVCEPYVGNPLPILPENKQAHIAVNGKLVRPGVVFAKVPRTDEIAILTASLWDTMTILAWQISVPPEHIEAGRTGKTFTSSHPNYLTPIDVRYSRKEPDDAYASVYMHNHWFYIDQNDLKSKRVFTFLELMMNLTETDVASQAPIMTISN